MLDVAEKPMTFLKPFEKTGPPDEQEPWKEESTTTHTLKRPEASEPEGTASTGGLTMVQR